MSCPNDCPSDTDKAIIRLVEILNRRCVISDLDKESVLKELNSDCDVEEVYNDECLCKLACEHKKSSHSCEKKLSHDGNVIQGPCGLKPGIKVVEGKKCH